MRTAAAVMGGAMTAAPLPERAEAFLGANRVFSRAGFAEAMDLPHGSEEADGFLSRQADAGRIREAAPDVYVVAWDPGSRGRFVVPDYLIASRLRPDGVLGYHTALELQGTNYALLYYVVHLVTSATPGYVDLPFQSCRFIRPHPVLAETGRTDFLTVTETRMGMAVKVTSSERTLVDVLYRPDLAGGRDEVLDSLDSAPYHWTDFDCRRVADYVELLGLRCAAGVIGWWLEIWQSELNVSERTLDRLEAMLPEQRTYALSARPGRADYVSRWRVYLPPDAIDAWIERLDDAEEVDQEF